MEQNNVIDKQEEFRTEVLTAAKAEITVVDQQTYVAANGIISKLQGVKKEVTARFAEPKRKAKEAHTAVCELEKSFLAPVEDAIRRLKDQTTRWYAAEQERIRAEEERRRKEAEELAAFAAEAESTGDSETAAEAVVAAVVESATVTTMPKVAGTSMREVWHAVVVDITKIPREYLTVDQAMLDRVATATKGAVPIPGVRFEKSYVNATRAK